MIRNKIRSHPPLLLKSFTKAVPVTVGSKHMREHGYVLMSSRCICYMAGIAPCVFLHILKEKKIIFVEKTAFGEVS